MSDLRTQEGVERHLREDHGWPEARLERLLLGENYEEVGRRRLTLLELRTKHRFDHSSGFKFTAANPHSHLKEGPCNPFDVR